MAKTELLYVSQKCGGIGSNGFHIKMPLKKNQNPGGPFWSYQLDSTANPANLPQKLDKWA